MTIRLHKDGRFFVAQCKHTGISGHGATAASAVDNLEDALSIWDRAWRAIIGGEASLPTAGGEGFEWPEEANALVVRRTVLHNPLRSQTQQ